MPSDPHTMIPGYERRAAYVCAKVPDQIGLVSTLVCCPRDRSQVPLCFKDMIRPVNVSDTLVTCWCCGDDCWMSDGQRLIKDSVEDAVKVMCFGCVATSMLLNLWRADNSANLLAPPNVDNRPRVVP